MSLPCPIELSPRSVSQTSEQSNTENIELLKRVALRDRSAMQSCLDRFGSLIWSMALKQLPRSDAEEIVQEVFMELWRTAHRFDSTKGKAITFVAVIARRRILDRRRKLMREPVLEDLNQAVETESPIRLVDDDNTFASQLPEPLHLAFAELSQEQRQAIEWVVGKGYTQIEAAKTLELPLGTLKSHLRRGLQRLRTTLNPTSTPNNHE